MNKNKKKLKTIVFSFGLAAMILPTTNLNAQINRGLLENPYKDPNTNRGMLNQQTKRDVASFSIENDSFDENAPLSSGIAVMLVVGLGYVVLKRKEEKL